MDHLMKAYYSWGNFFFVGILLLLLYFVLKFLDDLLPKVNILGKYQRIVEQVVHNVLLLYETIVLLVLVSLFVLINPLMHGLILLLVVAGGFPQIRNYINGRIFQYDSHIGLSKRLRTGDLQGIISGIGRLGIKLKTNKGVHFVNYTKMMQQGYLILSVDDEVGGFYKLKVIPKSEKVPEDAVKYLADRLTTTPYLDWNHKPELKVSDTENGTIETRVIVREESHLRELVTLINDWGFSCRVIGK